MSDETQNTFENASMMAYFQWLDTATTLWHAWLLDEIERRKAETKPEGESA